MHDRNLSVLPRNPENGLAKEIGRLGILVVCGVHALSGQAPSGEEVVLGGPEITKLDWNTRALVSHDIDGDGRVDLGLINNDSAKIELLYQTAPGEAAPAARRAVRQNRWAPILDDAHFRKESIVTGAYLYGLAVGDLDNDGRPDLAYTSNREPLTVRFQDTGGSWERVWTYDDMEPLQWAPTIVAQDVDGDGRDDLVVLAQGQLAIFFQGPGGTLAEPCIYRVADENSFGLSLIDLNADGWDDLIYVAGSDRRTLRVLFQEGARGFGPEIALPVEVASSSVLRWDPKGGAADGFAYINAKTRLFEVFKIAKRMVSQDSVERLQALSYSLGVASGSSTHYTFGDFDGDGRSDIAAGDAKGARIFVFLRNRQGTFENSRVFPSFSDISGLASGDFFGKGSAEIVVTSRSEGIFGLAHISAQGRLTFPSLLPSEGDPVCAAAGDVDGDGIDEIIFIEKLKSDYRLTTLKAASIDGGWDVRHTPLAMRREPEGLVPADLNGDGRLDLVIAMAREAARILVQGEDGVFSQVAEGSAVRKGLLSDLRPSNLGFGDVDGDGRMEMLITATGYARALRLNEDNDLEIVDQFNARQSDDRLSGPVMFDWGGDGAVEILFYDEQHGSLQILSRDGSGVYRYRRSVEVGEIDLVTMRISSSGRGSSQRLLMMGKDRFWAVPFEEAIWQIDVVDSYETDLKDIQYHGFEIADLNDDDRPEVIAVDPKKHLIEILRKSADNLWLSSVHFTVFDENPHYQGRRGGAFEPREMVVGDFTGDGRKDIALLVHDRVLLYFQE